MPREFPTELLNKYYARGVELCDAETPNKHKWYYYEPYKNLEEK